MAKGGGIVRVSVSTSSTRCQAIDHTLYREPVIIYEEQWDIYKLDPAYECIFFASPGRPIIRSKADSSRELPRQPARNMEVEEPPLQPAAACVPGQSAQGVAVKAPRTPQEPEPEPGQDRGRQSMQVDEPPPPLRPEPGVVRGPPVQVAAEEPGMHQQQCQDRGPQSMEVDEHPSLPELGVARGHPVQSSAMGEQQMPPEPDRDHDHQKTQAQDTPLREKSGPGERVFARVGRKANSNGERLGALNSQPSDGVRSNKRADASGLKDTPPTPVVEKRTGEFTMSNEIPYNTNPACYT